MLIVSGASAGNESSRKITLIGALVGRRTEFGAETATVLERNHHCRVGTARGIEIGIRRQVAKIAFLGAHGFAAPVKEHVVIAKGHSIGGIDDGLHGTGQILDDIGLERAADRGKIRCVIKRGYVALEIVRMQQLRRIGHRDFTLYFEEDDAQRKSLCVTPV